MRRIEIRNFGPVDKVIVNLDTQLNVIIGPQASGKSTVAKSIYFCRKIKDYLKDFLTTPENFSHVHPNELYINFLKNIRRQFMGCFGTTKHMSPFSIVFSFSSITHEMNTISIRLQNDGYVKITFNYSLKNQIQTLINETHKIYSEQSQTLLSFSNEIYEKFKIFEMIAKSTMKEISVIFNDEADIVYIPAGRSLLASMSEQLHDVKISEMDLTMQEFVERIRKTKSTFGNKIPDIVTNYLKTIRGQIKNEDVRLSSDIIREILKADYVSENDGEKLYYNDRKWVKLMYGSSGQQESLWILMLMFVNILEQRKTFYVLEEPEAHLYPAAQKSIIELIAAMINSTGSEMMMTTHSPYILTAINLLIYSGKVENRRTQNEENVVVKKGLRLAPNLVKAYLIKKEADFVFCSIMDEETGIIDASQIDEISNIINEKMDNILDVEIGYDL